VDVVVLVGVARGSAAWHVAGHVRWVVSAETDEKTPSQVPEPGRCGRRRMEMSTGCVAESRRSGEKRWADDG
jgi:hypothetical protein